MADKQFHIAGRNDGRLYYAVICDDQKTAIEELEKGEIDLTMRIGGKSLLRISGERGCNEIARLLITHGADPNEINGKRRHSLLHTATLSYNFAFAGLLLENQANPSPRSSNNATPLHLAARTGQGYLAQKLIDFKAEVNAQDTLGRTPLHLAMSKGRTGVAKLLLNANGNPAIPDRKGITPRQVAEALDLDI